MEYPGDTNLSREIQLRILSTFKQTLRQADREQWEESHFGCDFILRLDPAFEPARALKRRMDDSGPVELEDLREISARAGVEPRGAEPTDEGDESAPVDDAATSEDLSIEQELLSLDLSTDDEPTEELEEEDEGDEFEDELDRALSDLESETADQGGSDRESEQRIVQLLAEGQSAFDREDYQQAIDAWSRIFLIDIDHVEASRLIDKARLLKAESERELDEILHEGISHLEVGELAMARDAFNRVLALQPNHLVAKEYLADLDTETLGLDTETAAASIAGPPPPRRRPASAEAKPEKAVEPAKEEEPDETEDLLLDRPSQATPPPAKRPARKSFLYIGTAVLILAAAAGGYLITHWDQIFPNSTQETELAAQNRRADPIGRARTLHEAGETESAISQLERLAPEDPKYDEAQALIAQFQAQASAGAEAEDSGAVETAALLATLQNQVYEAYDEKRYLKSSLILDRIAEVQPLNEELQLLRGDLDAKLAPIQNQIDLIRQGEWEYALPQLWRLLDERPSDRDVLKLLVDGYFNLGVRDLQRGHPGEAAEKFKEALALSPDDSELQRVEAFAKAYQARPQDLRYRIFIKYVPFR